MSRGHALEVTITLELDPAEVAAVFGNIDPAAPQDIAVALRNLIGVSYIRPDDFAVGPSPTLRGRWVRLNPTAVSFREVW